MDMKAIIEKAQADTLHHTALILAAQELEAATYAARQAREDLRRATRNRLEATDRHADATRIVDRADVRDRTPLRVRVELLRWALQDAETAEKDALQDYRDALKRLEVLGATVGEADSHDVPAMVRHRARKAIALADSFGNKVAMDATQFDGLERPVLPELEPEVEVQEFRVIDPLEPVEAWTPPEPRAVLVPVEDYSTPSTITFEDPREARAARLRQSREEEVAYAERLAYLEAEHREEEAALRLYRILTGELPAPDEEEEDRMDEGERAAFWREVNHAQEDDAEKALEATREDDEAGK